MKHNHTFFSYLSCKFCFILVLLLFAAKVEGQGVAKFTENKGQWHSNIAYRLKLWGGDLFLEKQRFVFNFMEDAFFEHDHEKSHKHGSSEGKIIEGHAYFVNFLNSNANVSFLTEKEFSDLSHYYYGNDPTKWAENVHGYEGVSYQSLWKGIDAHVYSKEGKIKYDFIVHANTGNPAQIQLQYEGIEEGDLSLSAEGNLQIHTKIRDVTEQKPIAFQEINGQKIEVACAYQLNANQTVSFILGQNYNPAFDLIIDPTLIFSTYTGSTQDNWGFTATYDNVGNAFGGGIVWNLSQYQIGSIGYPTTPGAFQTFYNGGDRDAAITKYNPAGTNVIFSTYLGGSTEENPQSMVANSLGELIVLGRTNSLNFPATANAYDNTINGGYDFYLAKLSPTGTMQTCTFVGGAGSDGMNGILLSLPETYTEDYLNYNYSDDARGEVVVDNLNNVYVSGTSFSADFPVTPGCFQGAMSGTRDAVVFKMNPALSNLTWATYYGGTDIEAGYGIKVDNNYNVFFTGGTRSLNLPTTAGTYQPVALGGLTDGYLAKLDSTGGNLLAATYIGTSNTDQSYFVEIDFSQNIYITGQTLGNYPIVNAAYSVPNSRQFITKLDNNLTGIIYSTTFGVSGATKPNISPTAFLVDVCENVYVAGWGGGIQGFSPGGNSITGPGGGTTTGLPITPNALKSTTDGSDFYVFVLEPNATGLLFGTFYGGSSSQEHVDGGTSRFNPSGVIYEAVCASCGSLDPSTGGFPTTPGVWSPTNNSQNCNLGLFKIDLGLIATASAISAPDSACVNTPVAFVNNSVGATTYTWDFGDGSPLSYATNPTHTYTTAGTYTISLIANPPTVLCSIPDTTTEQIVILPEPTANFTYPATVCLNDTAVINYSGSTVATYTWSFGAGTLIPPGNGTGAGPHSLVITSNTTITLNVATAFGCKAGPISHTITVIPLPTSSFILSDTVCLGQNALATYTGNAPASATYSWNFGGGTATPGGFSQGPQNISWLTAGIHVVSLQVEASSGCKSPITSDSTFVYAAPIIALSLPDSACAGQTVSAVYTGPSLTGTIFHWDFAGASGGNPNVAGPQTLSWIIPGTYTISVWIDAGSGCKSDTMEQTIVISQIPTSAFLSPNTLCFGEVATINYNGNASANAQYSWTLNGLTPTPNPPIQSFVINTFPAAPDTFYLSLVVSENGCTSGLTKDSIIVFPVPIADFTMPDSGCVTVPIVATYTGSTGIANLLYHWNLGGAVGGNPNGIGPQNIFWNTPGVHTVSLWTEANGCKSDTITKDIFLKQGPPATIMAAPTDICISDTSVITYLGTSDPTYTFNWNFDGGFANPGVGAGPHSVSWLIPGIKNITLSLFVNGCPGKSDTAQVHVYAPPVADFAYPDSVCIMDSNQVVFTGTGSPNGTYNWNFGSAIVISGSGMGPYVLSWTTPGLQTICVQLTEPVCPATPTVCHNFTILEPPISNIQPVANQCFLNNSVDFTFTGSANIDAYYWGFPGGFPASSPLQNPTGIHYNSPGVYTAWVYAVNDGCVSDTSYISFEIVPNPSADFMFSQGPYCIGNCVSFTYTGTPVFPTQSYAWDFGTNTNPQFSTLQNINCVQFSQAGNQTVSLVVNYKGCKDSTKLIVPVDPSPTLSLGGDISFCQGEGPVQLNAIVANGTLPYYYTWTDIPVGQGGISNAYIQNPTANPTNAVDIICHIQDGQGCVSNYDTVKVIPVPHPKITAGPDMKVCGGFGNNGVQLQAVVLPPYNLAAPFHYSWTPSTGMAFGQDTLLNPIVNPTSTTVYTLQVTSVYGCKSDPLDTAATVIVDVIPTPIVDAGPFMEICKGDSIQLLGNVLQGTGNYTTTWTSALPNGGIANVFDLHSMAYPTYTHTYMLVAGTYGCYASDTMTIFVHTLPTGAIYPPSTSICQNDSILLTGIAGGDPFATIYTYSWIPSTNVQYPDSAKTMVYPFSTTQYKLQVATAHCKGFADSIVVTVLPTPIAAIATPDTAICIGDAVQLQLTYSFVGTPVGSPIFFDWQPTQSLNNPTLQNPWASPTQTTVYEVSAQVGACKSSDKVTVVVNQKPQAAILTDSTIICSNASVNLQALGGFSNSAYSWTPSSTIVNPSTQTAIANPDSTTIYQVWIIEGQCRDSASVKITTRPQPNADYIATNLRGCAPLEVQFWENTSDALSYIWDFGDGSPTINMPNISHTYSTPGTYQVLFTVVGEGGCKDNVSLNPVIVSAPPIVAFSSTLDNDSTIILPNGYVQFFDQSQHATSWQWNFGNAQSSTEQNTSYTYTMPGQYFVSLSVMNEFGCSAQIEKRYEVIAPNLFIPNTFTPNGDGLHETFVINYDGTATFHLEIYDRWGKRYFYSDSPSKEWKGTTLNGTEASNGVYYYSLRIGEKVFSGNVMLMR